MKKIVVSLVIILLVFSYEVRHMSENSKEVISTRNPEAEFLSSARFHKYNWEEINRALNIKFVSADGRFEAVYNTGTGKMAHDPANMGTYNYAPGSVNPIEYYRHNKYDKKPWKQWGNIKGFSYQDIIRLKSGYGSDEAEINEKEVERAIEQRKEEIDPRKE